jgi:hypothetical protein
MVMLVLISGSLVRKTNGLSSPTMLSKCSMYLTLQRRTDLWLCLGKKGLLGLKMLLRRRNTTSLTKFHPLTLHSNLTVGN